MPLLEIKANDTEIYEQALRDFLPERIIDAHSHIWLDEHRLPEVGKQRATAWSACVAKDNPIEDLLETYRLLLPGKRVTPVLFGKPATNYDRDRCNRYVEREGRSRGLPTLLLTSPELSPAELERQLKEGGHRGNKVYLNYSPAYIPAKEIRIFDFLPHSHLRVLDRLGMVSMLHIPRPGRLRDPVNLAQLLEIERRYPKLKLIVAHVGRAYADEDVGDAFKLLSQTRNMRFDISANVNEHVFTQLIEAVGPKRILFGTDMPVLRMRSARVVENGFYYNLIPKGLYGDVSGEPHMREVEGEAAEALTFMVYEEIAAFKRAAERMGLSRGDIGDVFCNNAAALFGVTEKGEEG